MSSPLEASVASPHPSIQIEPIAQALIAPQIHTHTHSTVETVHQTVLTTNDVIVQTQYTRTTTTLPNPVLPQEGAVEITEIADVPCDTSITQNLINLLPEAVHNSSNFVANTNDTVPAAQSVRIAKPKSPRAPRRAKVIKPMIRNTLQPQQNTNEIRYASMQSNPPMFQLQQQQMPTGPTMILQQVSSPGLMSAYVETLQQQSGQNVQYITTLGGQQESGYKPQYITTNQLVPGAYIQTASDNHLSLQNGGISVMPTVQMGQPQQTVLGTIIQQQPNAIQCGVISSEQLVLSSAPALEMFSDSTGSMFVSNQPIYYGLETIVSNTVMSSSQFMTGAMPQVLASSYQTTTQVFQASKLMDPMVDIPAVQGIPTGGYVVVNQSSPAREPIQRPPPPPPPPPPQILSTKPIISSSFNNSPAGGEAIALVQSLEPSPPPVVVSTPKPIQPPISTIPRVAVRPSPASHTITQANQINHCQWKVNEPLYKEQPINNEARPYFDSKRVSENTSMIKSSIASSTPLQPHIHMVQNNPIVNSKITCDLNNVHICNTRENGNGIARINHSCKNVGNTNAGQNTVIQSKLTATTTAGTLCKPMNRVLPMQAVIPKATTIQSIKKPEIVIEECKKPVAPPVEKDVSAKSGQKSITPVQKPIELVQKLITSPKIKQVTNIPVVKKLDMTDIGTVVMESDKFYTRTVEEPITLENSKLNLSKTPVDCNSSSSSSTPLKIVLQKQTEDGSYKISNNAQSVEQLTREEKREPSEVAPTSKVPQIASLQLLPIKTFTLKANKTEEQVTTNLPKPRVPPVAVKQPRVIPKMSAPMKNPTGEQPVKPVVTGPSLMYEIKSQDGFSHTASSMAEVWETVFQAVQNARKAHNLPPLTHNPLIEGLGLENNATIYLVEQLPGVNRCTKYKPKFHDLKPPKSRDLDNDSFAVCDNGAARAEPFKGRKVHDMFSWLASRHRQQPKMIPITEMEMR